MNILENANKLVNGDRQDSYGHPLDDFQCSADILRALTKRAYGIDVPFKPEFIGLFMACGIKGSREAGQHKRDTCTDGAGYYGTVDMVHEERARRAIIDDANYCASQDRVIARSAAEQEWNKHYGEALADMDE